MNVNETKTGFICKFGFSYVSIDRADFAIKITACVSGDERGTKRLATTNINTAVRAAIEHYTNPNIVAALKAIKAEMDELDAQLEPPRFF